MTPVNIIFIPVPMLSGNVGWQRQSRPPPYPREQRGHWGERQAIPVRDVQALLDDARRHIASDRDALKRTAHRGQRI
jgi:hypothetical protein